MGKGQRARQAASKQTGGLVFVPGRGLVPEPSSEPQRSVSASVKSSGAPVKEEQEETPRAAVSRSAPAPSLTSIDNKAVLDYLALSPAVRIASLEQHLHLNYSTVPEINATDSFKMNSRMLTDAMAALSVAPEIASTNKEVEAVPLSLNPAELASISFRRGLSSSDGSRIVVSMVAQVEAGLETGLVMLKKMVASHERAIEPFVLPLIPRLMSLQAEKSNSVRELSLSIAEEVAENLCPFAARIIFPDLISSLNPTNDWRVKVASLSLMDKIASRESDQLSVMLPEIIPAVSDCMKDPKKQVREIGEKAMQVLCSAISNEDIVHLVPELVSVISHPEQSAVTLDHLMETTFVNTVDAATLALITPLLIKCLKERSSPMKRKAARVIDNMCRLVHNPSDVAPFLPFLLPALDKVVDENSNIEIVNVAQEARNILVGVMTIGQNGSDDCKSEQSPTEILDFDTIFCNLSKLVKNIVPFMLATDKAHHFELLVYLQICNYVSTTVSYFVIHSATSNENLYKTVTSLSLPPDAVWRYVVSTSSSEKWSNCVAPYIEAVVPEEEDVTEDTPEVEGGFEKLSSDIPCTSAYRTSLRLRRNAMGDQPDREHDTGKDSADDLCNIEFSLAFGAKILLHNANLKLGKGHVYGIMGKNGAGKTTLLTNMASGNIEGLPDTLKSVYVQHDDQGLGDDGMSVLDEMISGADMIEAHVEKTEAESALAAIGFTPSMLSSPRSALSGGWKMKLMIIRAMLSRADILLLDEPTNHLDAASVDWLAQYLQSQQKITALIVSHDSLFLDRVITDVIHYESLKLAYYPGSLKDFVKQHPEAKYYYDLSTSSLKFVFPTPDRLDGISSTTKTILKMDHVTYTYPGADSPTISDVSVRVCLASRIGITGKNGAGKSTLVKLLVQENEPDSGVHPDQEVWKHRNLRIAYVAQHSFHHVEQHLNDSPVDYIKWRFADGFDREDMTKASTELTEEEKEPKKLGDVDKVLGRRKNGRTMEYECSIVGQGQYEDNVYIPLGDLVKMGHQKLVTQCDTKIAAAVAGLDVRPLITKEIQGHLDDFNLEAEYGTHSKIRLLSGGQKVKLVLAAAMWNRPHLIVLDEPTNYLDREALAALTEAIKAFSGGIIIISHNSEFTKAVCTETWHVENKECVVEGAAKETSLKTKAGMTRKEKNNREERELAIINSSEKDGVNLNKTKLVHKEHLKNPRTLEYLTKVEIRKLTKLAKAAGLPLKEYVGKITKESPEWKWL